MNELTIELELAEDRWADEQCRLEEMHRDEFPAASELQAALARYNAAMADRLPAGWSLGISMDTSTLPGRPLAIAVATPLSGPAISAHGPSLADAVDEVIREAWNATAAVA